MLYAKFLVKLICIPFFVFLFIRGLTSDVFVLGKFIVTIPFVGYCFFNNKILGAYAYIMLVVHTMFSFWTFVTLLFYLSVFLFVNVFVKHLEENGKLLISLLNFFFVFVLETSYLFGKYKLFLLIAFLCAVGAYWVSNFLYELYFDKEDKLDEDLSVFIFVLGVLFIYGIDIYLFELSVSYALMCLMLLTLFNVSKKGGVVLSFSLFMVFALRNQITQCLFLFVASIISFFCVRRASKAVVCFLDVLVAFFVMYKLKLDVMVYYSFVLGIVVYLFVPVKFIKSFCVSDKERVEKCNFENRRFNSFIANKVIELEETFSLICEKIGVNDRLKKNDKKLFVEEIDVFKNLLFSFSHEIKSNAYNDNDDLVKKEFYKNHLYLKHFKCSEGEKIVVSLFVFCNKKEVFSKVIPILENFYHCKFVLDYLSHKDLMNCYKIRVIEKKRKSFKYGVSQISLDPIVCGDSYIRYENKKYHLFALSDGMGSGKVAKSASKLALNILIKFLNVGFSIEQSIRSLNNVLKCKYERDFYTTLDVLLLDKEKETFYSIKCGASDSYIVNERVSIVKGNDLPLGIVDVGDFSLKKVELYKGDVFVLCSDGVSEKSVVDNVYNKKENMQELSDLIIRDGVVVDDKTVFSIKIC